MRFACLARRIAVTLIAAALSAAPVAAQDLAFPRSKHPWGRFPVGSWKAVRTTSESLDEKSRVTSITITETRTTLVAADDSTYTLSTDSTVDVASRRIIAAPQTTTHGYYGETPGTLESVKHTGDASLTIDGRTIPCEVRQLILTGQSGKLVSTIHYSSQVPPFIFRRESSVEAAPEETRKSSLVEVVALALPQRIRGQLKQASYIKTTQKFPQASKVTLEVHCQEVPGGVAAHWASETDSSGRVVRRSTLELIDYGLSAPLPAAQPQPGLLRRPFHKIKAARRMDPR
jgi:hypothetical protein